MSRPMFPHVIDSTMLEAWRSCRQKMFRQYVQHWKPLNESVHLVAGGAFAEGLEKARRAFYNEGADPDQAMAVGIGALIHKYGDFEAPVGSPKTLERMMGAFEHYFSVYPLETEYANPVKLSDGSHAIEFSFAEPLGILHPVSGDPILYVGRMDQVVEYAGAIRCEDDKTTTSLGASWAKQWEMRGQFTGYCWALRKAGISAGGALVRGISILKTKYDTLEVPTDRSIYETERWYDQTCRDIEQMIAAWRAGYWDWNLGGSCTEYGGCAFVPVCKHQGPEKILPIYFERRVWDPLLRKETSVQEYEASWGHVSNEAPVEEKLPLAQMDMTALNEDLAYLRANGAM